MVSRRWPRTFLRSPSPPLLPRVLSVIVHSPLEVRLRTGRHPLDTSSSNLSRYSTRLPNLLRSESLISWTLSVVQPCSS
ncbi:hypothetical protein LEP1GSC024_1673 [Leptospira noguchii str. 2001034031]|uniref:Uncharacterized protein n=1 Tax=Leptospira noguchii str. 2001034031 TaxID=1193053 RepID=M6YC70_9LEPT|nr:hypothetical protein LEP1GSC024_1673 [Leptospira noguchii str. 2001034031]